MGISTRPARTRGGLKRSKKVRVWWPPTTNKKRSGYSGAYWPASVLRKTTEYHEVEYDNGSTERVANENIFPFDLPVPFGGETTPIAVGEFVEVSNDSKTDPCAWLGRVARVEDDDKGYFVEYPFHDSDPEVIAPTLIRRARVWDNKAWHQIVVGQSWEEGEVTAPLELHLTKDKEVAKALAEAKKAEPSSSKKEEESSEMEVEEASSHKDEDESSKDEEEEEDDDDEEEPAATEELEEEEEKPAKKARKNAAKSKETAADSKAPVSAGSVPAKRGRPRKVKEGDALQASSTPSSAPAAAPVPPPAVITIAPPPAATTPQLTPQVAGSHPVILQATPELLRLLGLTPTGAIATGATATGAYPGIEFAGSPVPAGGAPPPAQILVVVQGGSAPQPLVGLQPQAQGAGTYVQLHLPLSPQLQQLLPHLQLPVPQAIIPETLPSEGGKGSS